ncbi:MAG: sulfatase [Ardenticatenaceae bacterium]|nr:sulfatase [Anaerolineales bacterium]MCB8940663.1 sulfatase [Ardenticatenaceae bacterium]MCB8971993.1 sulfatase [Ardenticatenaceae bacterium]
MDQPDIIFIVLDTQRADRLGCYGHSKAITPNLDQFAANGVLFEQAISPAQWTIPSHASMFTGLYPTAHQVTQSSQGLSPERPHLAELLRDVGYQTVAFCNNPLVGILNNGFKRGFQTFYNYGGAIPSVPSDSTTLPRPLRRLVEGYTQFLRRISYPIQNFFGQSDLAFRLSLNAWFTPIWSRVANFKGQNERSVRDLSHFFREREKKGGERPLFLFLNLMETHLPFTPPAEFIDKVAPYLRGSKEARTIMRRWNRESYRWAAPLAEPLDELEAQVLSDLYDAEVAYQDAYLGQLLQTLQQRANAENTLIIIVADHGDGLGEHGCMGHAFVAYQELLHVPLLMQWPRRFKQPARVQTPVSTRRVFHTMLDAAGRLPQSANLDPVRVHGLTLATTVNGHDPEQGVAYSEVYPPLTFVKALEKRQPELLEAYRCLSVRRAVVQQIGPDEADVTLHKLIQVDEKLDELFNLADDPIESVNVMAERPFITEPMQKEMNRWVTAVSHQKTQVDAGSQIELDENITRRLRALGYMD